MPPGARGGFFMAGFPSSITGRERLDACGHCGFAQARMGDEQEFAGEREDGGGILQGADFAGEGGGERLPFNTAEVVDNLTF
jgi:hypothetical protein